MNLSFESELWIWALNLNLDTEALWLVRRNNRKGMEKEKYWKENHSFSRLFLTNQKNGIWNLSLFWKVYLFKYKDAAIRFNWYSFTTRFWMDKYDRSVDQPRFQQLEKEGARLWDITWPVHKSELQTKI